MVRCFGRMLLAVVFVFMFTNTVMAASDVPFPADWKSWVKQKEYKFPCDKIAELPKVLQNVGTIYCPLLTENSVITIYARPEAKTVLDSTGDAASQEFPDGANFIFAITDVQGLGEILLVKGHDLGAPVYGVYKADGTDIEGAAKPISKGTCTSCHDAYCIPHGVCSSQPWNK